MSKNFMLIPAITLNKPGIAEIIRCNEVTSRFGLTLSRPEAEELAATYVKALSDNERVEFGGNIVAQIILQFCDSPFLSGDNYAATLNELVETFYYFKNETFDQMDDDELIAWMKRYFNQTCRGSLELLQNRELESLARHIRYGEAIYEAEDEARDLFEVNEEGDDNELE
jgi:hypothetical protein